MKSMIVTLTGTTPLLMKANDINWADSMTRWQSAPANKKNSTPGDDRTPAWRWLGCCYHDSRSIVIPADNLMTVLREGGTKVGTGKKQGTFKRLTQSGIVIDTPSWAFTTSGKAVSWPEVWALREVEDFEAHEEAARKLGFELFTRRATIGQAKHIRVRPRFDTWTATGKLTILDDAITKDVLCMILDAAGTYAGIGDWRPSAPKSPGPFGKFTAEVKNA